MSILSRWTLKGLNHTLFNSWTFQGLSDELFSPKANDIETKIEEIKQKLPTPVFWLLGKTQAGKSSLIRALTGNAEVGNGFQPCTKRSQFYDFPSSSHPLIRFLDTRGLGETAYNPSDDLAWCANQAHLLIVVMKVFDMNQREIVDAALSIHKEHPNWQIIVLQTTLHEGYSKHTAQHIEPYPYQEKLIPPTVSHELTQALLHQRDWLKGVPVHFVPIDFTLPEDGFNCVNYGLDELWDVIELALPKSIIGLLRGSEQHKELLDFHAREAHPHIIGYSVLNTGMGAIPIAGLPLVLGVQGKLFHSIASIYNLKLSKQLFAEFTVLIGTGVGVGMLGRELLKLIPVYGWAVAGAYSGAMTYALGQAFCVYLNGVKRGALPNQEELKQTYDAAFVHARQFLKNKEN
jgi:uncharacterized protein (DUF697 family)